MPEDIRKASRGPREISRAGSDGGGGGDAGPIAVARISQERAQGKLSGYSGTRRHQDGLEDGQQRGGKLE